MTAGAPYVATVLMPERGSFLVTLPEGFDSLYGTRCLVQLDYGEDVGIVKCAAPFDPAVHGPRIPGFRFIRPLAPDDDARLAANADLAESMCVTFQKLAAADGHTLQLCHKRLSFGRDRLFVRFFSEERRPDLSRPCSEIRRLFNATVNAWQIGLRDEVSLKGALGCCGRVCCCCDWQTRYPQGLTAARVYAMGVSSSGQNGVCGRYRCCLAFEEDDLENQKRKETEE